MVFFLLYPSLIALYLLRKTCEWKNTGEHCKHDSFAIPNAKLHSCLFDLFPRGTRGTNSAIVDDSIDYKLYRLKNSLQSSAIKTIERRIGRMHARYDPVVKIQGICNVIDQFNSIDRRNEFDHTCTWMTEQNIGQTRSMWSKHDISRVKYPYLLIN